VTRLRGIGLFPRQARVITGRKGFDRTLGARQQLLQLTTAMARSAKPQGQFCISKDGAFHRFTSPLHNRGL
jgi:hypothetical protein